MFFTVSVNNAFKKECKAILRIKKTTKNRTQHTKIYLEGFKTGNSHELLRVGILAAVYISAGTVHLFLSYPRFWHPCLRDKLVLSYPT